MILLSLLPKDIDQIAIAVEKVLFGDDKLFDPRQDIYSEHVLSEILTSEGSEWIKQGIIKACHSVAEHLYLSIDSLLNNPKMSTARDYIALDLLGSLLDLSGHPALKDIALNLWQKIVELPDSDATQVNKKKLIGLAIRFNLSHRLDKSDIPFWEERLRDPETARWALNALGEIDPFSQKFDEYKAQMQIHVNNGFLDQELVILDYQIFESKKSRAQT